MENFPHVISVRKPGVEETTRTIPVATVHPRHRGRKSPDRVVTAEQFILLNMATQETRIGQHGRMEKVRVLGVRDGEAQLGGQKR